MGLIIAHNQDIVRTKWANILVSLRCCCLLTWNLSGLQQWAFISTIVGWLEWPFWSISSAPPSRTLCSSHSVPCSCFCFPSSPFFFFSVLNAVSSVWNTHFISAVRYSLICFYSLCSKKTIAILLNINVAICGSQYCIVNSVELWFKVSQYLSY